MAQTMESEGVPKEVNVSEQFANRVQAHVPPGRYFFHYHRTVEVPGRRRVSVLRTFAYGGCNGVSASGPFSCVRVF